MLFSFCWDNLEKYWKTVAANTLANAEDSVALKKVIEETDYYLKIDTGGSLPLLNPVFIKETAKNIPFSLINSRHSFWCDSRRNKELVWDNTKFVPVMEHVPVMIISLNKEFNVVLPSGVSIEIVKADEDLAKWIKPIQIAFGMDEDVASRYQACFEKCREQFVHFVVKKDQEVIGAASLFLHEHVAGFYNLAVLPEYRKQGIGAALHHARLAESKRRGYQYATLQASPMAAHLDRSIGFEECSEISIYTRPELG